MPEVRTGLASGVKEALEILRRTKVLFACDAMDEDARNRFLRALLAYICRPVKASEKFTPEDVPEESL